MGNNSSQPSSPAKIVPFNIEVEVIKNKYSDEHYGEVKVVRDVKTEKIFILKEVVVNSKQAFETEVEAYKKRIALKYPNVVNIVGYTTQEKSNFCSTHYRISLYIENIEKTLATELTERQTEKTEYSENQLLYIADSLISGLSYFQAQGFSHDDIRPFNIFVHDNTYKLSDPFLNAQKDTNALTFAILKRTKTTLAPELLPQVPVNQFEIKADRNLADVYSLGITLLSLATLTNHEDLYNIDEGKIDQELLQARIQDLRIRYSKFTADLIESMLQENIETRPNFAALSNTLLPYQTEIREGSQLPFLTHHHHAGGEQVKRSHNVVVEEADDLDARIKAALERSAATFKAVAGHEGVVVNAGTTSTPIVENTSTTTYNYTSTYTPTTTEKVIEVTTVKETQIEKSSAPKNYLADDNQTYIPQYQYTYTTTTEVQQPVVVVEKTEEKPVSTIDYTTSTYNYTPVVEKTEEKPVSSYEYTTSTYTYTPVVVEKTEEKPVSTYDYTSSTYNYTPVVVEKTTEEKPVSSYYGVDLGNAGTANQGTTSYNYTSSYVPSGTGATAGTEDRNAYSYSYTSPYTATETVTTTTYNYTYSSSNPIGVTTVVEGKEAAQTEQVEKKEEPVSADVNVHA